MRDRADAGRRLARQLHACWVIAKKDARIYYLKPQVATFGVVFPLFFYLAFAAGRPMAVDAMVPGVVAMALFFTASAVGPLVTPWERQARTYERLVTSPASMAAILAGDMLAGAAFGAALSVVPILVGFLATTAAIVHTAALILGIALGACCFAALGVLLAATAGDSPPQVMMLSNLVRLPLIFVSGVFEPHADMPRWGQWLAPASPLSYAAELIRVGYGGAGYFGAVADIAALVLFTVAFLAAARFLHARDRRRGW